MTSAIHITPQPNAKAAAAINSQALSISDMAIVVDMLLSIRVTAHTTSCLANHMGRDGVEDFADSMVETIDWHLHTMAAALYPRPSSEAQALVARIEAIVGEVRRHD